ncbi:O-antigen ligase family protein [Hydrogenophaga sp.]|uniref:O-antigen ligase family protein n=1 Tax=Hydrogenophaga sp. TaxID=1904254 RepID=UPI002637C246|nr:O-antigen ligase family protein [Hydrogenophaga sp.]MDM7948217.1 O-antigen ligase family protein [Hydrogenophaga sp.]
MSRHRFAIVVFMVAIALAQSLIEPAYLGYLVAFALLSLHKVLNPSNLQYRIRPPSMWWLPFCIWLVFMGIITYLNEAQLRDVLRDLGAIAAFFVGRFVFLGHGDPVKQNLKALSEVGLLIVVATLVAASLAYIAGASAYQWRGEFIPPSHSWLPYLMVVNYVLAQTEKSHAAVYVRRFAFCVVGTLASLSRTDLILVALFLFVLLVRHLPQLLANRLVRRRILYGLCIVVLLLPLFISLDVVQNRIASGVGADDSSVGWRLMENASFLDMMLGAGPVEWLAGFGFGARVPLPSGVLDFNDNTSIPHLHNSFLTIIVKFGLVGIVMLLIYLARHWSLSHRSIGRELEILHAAGRWIVLFVLLKAVTLQGLTEWSHVLFLGLGCAFMVRVERNHK